VGQHAHGRMVRTSGKRVHAVRTGPRGCTAFLADRTRNSVVTPPAGCTTLTGMDEKAIRRAALITLRRATCVRFPPGLERRAWLRWL
jgi:hypothetical protein